MTRFTVLALCLSAFAGCARSPANLGTPPAAYSDATIGLPGLNSGSGPYTPSLVPSTGGGRYFGND